jgi:hypothetical protein
MEKDNNDPVPIATAGVTQSLTTIIFISYHMWRHPSFFSVAYQLQRHLDESLIVLENFLKSSELRLFITRSLPLHGRNRHGGTQK